MRVHGILGFLLLLVACGGSTDAVPPPVAPVLPPPVPPPPVAVAPAGPAAPRTDAGLIPRNTLFGNPERIGAQISPDGKWIAFIAPVDGVLNVMVAPSDDIKKAQPATHDKARPVYQFAWPKKKNTILYMQDAAGDENWHVYAVTLPGNETKDLTPYKGVSAQFSGVSVRHPGEVLIGMNDRDAKYHDLYSVNLDTGARTLVLKNDRGFAGFVTDDDFKVRLAAQPQPDGSTTYFAAGPKHAFDAVYMTVPFDDALTTQPSGFDDTGRTLYMIDSRERDTAGLFALDFATKKSRLLAEDPKSDIQGVMPDPRTHRPVAAIANYDRQRHIILDKAVQTDEDYLKTVVPGADFNVGSCSDDFKRCIVEFTVSDGPIRFYLYDRTKHHADFLFVHRPKLEGLKLAKMHARVIPARDGLPLVSYLSLPPGSDPDGDGVPDRALPTVLLVHGGPWGRDDWGYNRDHQWLANRGYAVLSVNFRGSTGLGKKLLLSRSPLTHANAIKKPLLIGQGANDVRVKQAESDQIVKAMQAKGIPVTYVLFSDEGHGFARPENEKAVDAVAETFLAQCLGGSYEPVGADFKGSTISVPSGAEQVYGVADALKAGH